MSQFKIGDFEFINMSRLISRPTKRLTREVRSGVAGVTFWNTGKRAEPIIVETVVDTADKNAATNRIFQYEQLIGASPVIVTWFGSPIDGIRVVVMDVQPAERGVHTMLLGVGGVTGGVSHGLCRAIWLLNSIDAEQ